MASKSSRSRKAPVTRSSPTARTSTITPARGTARSGSSRAAADLRARDGVRDGAHDGVRDGARGAARPQAAGRSGGRAPEPAATAGNRLAPSWLQWLTFALAIAGLGVSSYLTYTHFTDAKILGCAENSTINCLKVTTSPQSYVFGIPVALLGLLFYVALVPILSPWAWQMTRRLPFISPVAWQKARRALPWVRLGSLLVGIGFVLYLVYAELYEIDAICLYCTSVHIITFLLFALTVFAAAVWGLRPADPDDDTATVA
jgi:uncharacterized membrane protein